MGIVMTSGSCYCSELNSSGKDSIMKEELMVEVFVKGSVKDLT